MTDAVPFFSAQASTLTLDPRLLEQALEQQQPQAIIVAHLDGQLAAVEDIARYYQSSLAGLPLALPCYPDLPPAAMARVAGCIREFFAQSA